MSRLRGLWQRLRGIVPSQQREQDFAAELDAHLELHIEDNLRAGMTPVEARRQAILKLGGVESTKQAYRNQGTVAWLEETLYDIRFGTRQLVRNPGFAVTAILMLALGLCASTALFAFVDAALIRPLPYAEPARLVDATETVERMGPANLSYLDYLDWKQQNQVFQSLETYTGTGYLLATSAGTEVVTGLRVSDGFFRTLGIEPALGRDFYAGEDLPSAPRSVMLSFATWQNRYGARPGIIGETVTLSGLPYTVVGVLPRTFQFARRNNAEYWSALHATGECEGRRSCHNLVGLARLKPGVTVAAAQAAMTTLAGALEREYPGSNRGQGAIVRPLSDAFLGEIRPILLTLLAGAALLLLIAYVNVASLLLVRSESRRREFSVRGALGATRARLTRQFITEGLLLVLTATAAGLLAALASMHLLLHLVSKDMLVNMPYLEGIGLNLHVLGFALAEALVAVVLFSATPMLRLASANVRAGLAEGSRGSAGVLWRRLGSNLVIVELAIAMVLLVGAGLLGKSFYRLLHVDLGFEPQHLAMLAVAFKELPVPPGAPPATADAPFTVSAADAHQIANLQAVLTRLRSLPGVVSAGVTSVPPVSGNGDTDWIRFVGRPYDGKHIEVNDRAISPLYFQTLKARMLRGRLFDEQEDGSRARVAIVNQSFARKYYPGEDALGKVYGNTELSPKSLRQIVGVVEDIKEASLDQETWPTEYEPYNQSPSTYTHLLVRTTQPEGAMLNTLVAAIHEANADAATTDQTTMLTAINESQTAYLHRSSAWLVGGFAALALLLGVVGLYGVIAYSVSQRTREIGVRMALGAQRATVYRLVLGEAGWLTFWGLFAGIVCAIGAATLMRSLLFGTAAWDATTIGSVALVLATSAMTASFLPARRAASVNPTEALRAE